jgi:alpha-glucoside transport system permease protein
LFLLPALVLLGAIVVYPIVATVVASFHDKTGGRYVGLANYRAMFENHRILLAIRNNIIWVVVVPAAVAALGLMFAVLTERVSYGRAFKAAVFMPMAISLLAGGVIWRVVYEQSPQRGLINAAIGAVVKVFRPPGGYVGALPSEGVQAKGKALQFVGTVGPGASIQMGLVGLAPERVPKAARPANVPTPRPDQVAGVVFRDFRPGGGGQRGVVDPGELGLPGVRVDLRDAHKRVVKSALTGDDGTFRVGGVSARGGPYRVEMASANFRPAFQGIEWLGPTLITPAIIVAYIWVWAGFGMMVIAAGLAAIPREVLEAARVDGANEWQTFRRVTVPLLAPELGVVFITLVINVLKVFDIVLVVAPQAVQNQANVIALEMWRTAFGARDQGLGAAVAVLLFALVLPVMVLNVRRFRAERA